MFNEHEIYLGSSHSLSNFLLVCWRREARINIQILEQKGAEKPKEGVKREQREL